MELRWYCAISAISIIFLVLPSFLSFFFFVFLFPNKVCFKKHAHRNIVLEHTITVSEQKSETDELCVNCSSQKAVLELHSANGWNPQFSTEGKSSKTFSQAVAAMHLGSLLGCDAFVFKTRMYQVQSRDANSCLWFSGLSRRKSDDISLVQFQTKAGGGRGSLRERSATWSNQYPALKEVGHEFSLSLCYPRCVDPSQPSCQYLSSWSKLHYRWKEKRQHFEDFLLKKKFSNYF